MADEARYVLFRWREHGHIDDRYADRWDELLARPLAEIKPGRDRDWEFAAEALRCALVDEDVLLSRVGDLPVAGEARAHIRGRLGAIVATLRSGAS